MKVYHGSPNKFKKFDYSRIRENGTTEGVGFYFTDTERIARGYGQGGYLYEVELRGKKPLSDTKLTLTKAEAKKIIIEIDEAIGFLENYGEVGYEGYNNVLNTALESEYGGNDTDTDFMGSIYNACGESEEVVKLFHKVLGYDYIIADEPAWGKGQKVYVALTNDIINIKKITKI